MVEPLAVVVGVVEPNPKFGCWVIVGSDVNPLAGVLVPNDGGAGVVVTAVLAPKPKPLDPNVGAIVCCVTWLVATPGCGAEFPEAGVPKPNPVEADAGLPKERFELGVEPKAPIEDA